MLGACTQQVWLESIWIWVFNSREIVIFGVTLCNIRMLQSVSHILDCGDRKIGQILMKFALLEQAHEMQSFNALFAEFR